MATKITSKQTSAQMLVSIIHTVSMFKSKTGIIFALPSGKPAIYPVEVESQEFTTWVNNTYFKKYHKFPPGYELAPAIKYVVSETPLAQGTNEVHLRFGHNKGTVYIDLANDNNEVVAISDTGWNITASAPIYFKKVSTQLAIPTPEKYGDYLKLGEFINIDDDSKMVLLSTLCSLAHGNYVRPLLGLIGPEGSGKTSAARFIRTMLDPNGPQETSVHTTRDLMLTLNNNAIPILDNITKFTQAETDSLCKATTGTGSQERKYYTNHDLLSLYFQRTTIYTALKSPTQAPDFLGRTLEFDFNRIPHSQMKSDSDLPAEFDKQLPNILGGFYTTISEAMKLLPTINLPKHARWCDAFKLSAAAAEVLGYGANRYAETCLAMINARKQKISKIAKNNDSVDMIKSVLRENNKFTGTTSELWQKLTSLTNSYLDTPKWLQSSVTLGKHLGTIIADLEDAGISFTKKPANKGTIVALKLIQASPVEVSDDLPEIDYDNLFGESDPANTTIDLKSETTMDDDDQDEFHGLGINTSESEEVVPYQGGYQSVF
ncbi:hypothetical protein [Solidesulfovibrio magneticus]|uniref:ATP-binding protein n=1 Tax=Solidesulfovibrio magneticus (strain ATCC 700980 / DSM 13731 / RS-1) TaxID=573370 RepID=C4XK24_SOLM1|nr:hypothetical protein [Solidesulfovibrio magneticus]BAH74379.1 hypothetical protein DMR_08880 [Solidesulfovibrio magneticus RS-1]